MFEHRFFATTWNGTPILGRWKCIHCKMRVKDTRQARKLEGKPCYG